MENYAKKLAIDHRVSKKSNSKTFPIYKLREDFKYIGKTYDVLNESVSNGVSIPPSGEWILDNYYLIEEQVNTIQKEISLSQYKKLPSVNGISRIYIIAKALVYKTDAIITEENVENFICAYQTKKSLSMDELWLFPVMLKISVIEYIKELCEKIISTQLQKFKVESLIERLVKNKPINEQRFHRYSSTVVSSEANAYVEHLVFCLKKLGKDGLDYINILEEEIKKVGTTYGDVIRVEHYDSAVRRVSMGNCITSVRHISRFNWITIFERTNVIEKILSRDQWYPKLDFETRNLYRNEIKEIARESNTSEVYIANKIIEIAGAYEHIGVFLIGGRKEEFYKLLGINNYKREQSLNIKVFEYIIAIYLPTILFAFLLAREAFFLSLIPVSEMFVYLINKILTKHVKPRLLPRLEEIPEGVNTFVVVPTLLNSKQRVIDLFKSMERYYIGNKMDNIYFALLGDASEVETEKMPYDAEVIESGIEESRKLNEKYGKEIFFFLYRRRVFNEKQGKWLGYERKRGMLTEFNNFLITGENGTFQTNTIGSNILNKKLYVN